MVHPANKGGDVWDIARSRAPHEETETGSIRIFKLLAGTGLTGVCLGNEEYYDSLILRQILNLNVLVLLILDHDVWQRIS